MLHRLIFIGPQGSGKGTQAAFFSKQRNLPSISTGDLFRDHIKRGTDLGQQAKQLVDAGTLVPDEITNAMLRERLSQPDAANGYILDGYPRTPEQALFLDTIAPPDCVIEIQLSEAAAHQRIGSRRLDVDTGATVSLELLTPEQQQYYRDHPDKLVVRDDDTPTAVTKRLALYRSQTEPVLSYYQQQAKLISVDGAPAIEKVTAAISQQLKKLDSNAVS